MKPEPKNEAMRNRVDSALYGCIAGMHDAGAPLGMIIDRLLTYTIAQMATIDGSKVTASNLRTMADKVEGGYFHRITGESGGSRQKH